MFSFVCHDGSCMHSYVWYDTFMVVACMCVTGLFHTCDWIIQILGPDTRIEYYSVIYSLINIHVRFFIMLNPSHTHAHEYALFFLYTYTCVYVFVIMIYTHTYTFISRKRWNLWKHTFVNLYFRDACNHMCGMIIYMYFILHTHACLCITFCPYRCTYIMSEPTHS